MPGRLSVVSLYGVRQPLPCRPSLASVCVDPSDAGREAVTLLAGLIAGEVPPAGEVILESWYVNGESLGPPG